MVAVKQVLAGGEDRHPARQYGIDFLEQELLEFSIVTIPANSDALIDPGGPIPGSATPHPGPARHPRQRGSPMTKPTLEQKIVRAIADGDEAVAEALCRHLWRGRTRVVYRLAAGGV